MTIVDSEIVKAHERLVRSALVLTAFFAEKLHIELELLTKDPERGPIDGLEFDLSLKSLGFWGLQASKPLDENKQREVASAFYGLLGGMQRLEQKRQRLKVQEENLTSFAQPSPSNVIPLRRPRPAQPPPVFSRTEDRRWILKMDCLIESAIPGDIHKMAAELHGHSQRYAFVQFRDLLLESRSDLPDILAMGAVSLFIDNLEEVPHHEQVTLERLVQIDSNQRPLILAGIHLPFAEVRSRLTIKQDLLAHLSRTYIKLSRPFHTYKEQGLIHYFLDSLSQNPS